ncbi:MAG: hypothetical protein J7641_07880 [Cyanobacteria bacterium SID2]|nr:hypothetical protein [Cyanobacteria bacterium SID2]MBP0004643.1 hypothetical protein [Cyanobacteria bacterium SBC]
MNDVARLDPEIGLSEPVKSVLARSQCSIDRRIVKAPLLRTRKLYGSFRAE